MSNCTSTSNGIEGFGFSVGAGSIATGCASRQFATGFITGDGARLESCTARFAQLRGVLLDALNVVVTNCSITSNTTTGIEIKGVGNFVADSLVTSNGSPPLDMIINGSRNSVINTRLDNATGGAGNYSPPYGPVSTATNPFSNFSAP